MRFARLVARFCYNKAMMKILPPDFRGPASWTTVAHESQIEFEERRSRFIGICLPIRDGAEAEERLARCRADFPDATHWVYAWRHIFPEIGGKYSDDGEPKGTAGLPVLDVLRKGGVDQAQILVVRYFGGVLLGTGGLVKSYTQAAAQALAAAGLLTMVLQLKMRVMVPYAVYDSLRYKLKQAGFQQAEAEFGLDVEWQVALPPDREADLRALVAEQSQGQGICLAEGLAYAPQGID